MELFGRDFNYPSFREWFNARPPEIQELVTVCPPGSLMVNKPTGQLMEIISWFENGTVRAGVDQDLNNHLRNALPENYNVFGLLPEDLEFYCWTDDDDKIASWHGSKEEK